MKRLILALCLILSAVPAWSTDEIMLSGFGGYATCPLMMMAEDGVFSQLGVKTIFHPWNTPDQYRAKMSSGTSAFIVVSALDYLRLAESVGGMKLMFTVENTPLFILAPEERLTLEALAGRTIALPFRGDMPELTLKLLLKPSGVPFDKVRILSAGGAIPSAQLAMTGRADVAMLPEPAASSVVTLSRTKKGLTPLHHSLSVTDEWNRQYPDGPPLILTTVISYRIRPDIREQFVQLYPQYFASCRKEPERAVSLFVRHFPAMSREAALTLVTGQTETLHSVAEGNTRLDAFLGLIRGVLAHAR